MTISALLWPTAGQMSLAINSWLIQQFNIIEIAEVRFFIHISRYHYSDN